MQTQPSAIQVVGVTHHYGVRPIVKDVDMTVHRGELVAIMGPNGSGKSTLMGVLAGALSPFRGYVQINGLRRRRTAAEELAIRKQVVFLPAEPWLPHTRPGREWVLAVGRWWGVDDDRLMDHAQRLIELFDLTEKADAPIGSYSTGQRKKLALAAALITDAPILLLDEPFAGGLDPSGILALKRVLGHHAEQSSATIVMATPVPELVEELADRVAIMRDGRLVAFDTVSELRRQTQCDGALDQIYEQLVNPEMRDKVGRYFETSSTEKAARQ
jgi:ABC-type multidrug transport system ATPase subunit